MSRGDRAVVGGKLAPLAARSGQPDQTIENGTSVTGWTSTFFARFVDDQKRRDPGPEGVGSFPDHGLYINLSLVKLSRGQALRLSFSE